MVEPFSEEYNAHAAFKKIPLDALKNIRKYIDLVLNKQQLSAPGGKTPEKESVLKKLNDSKAALEQKKLQPQQKATEHTL